MRQTPTALNHLVRAYRAVLRNMRRPRISRAIAITSAGISLTGAAHACELCGSADHEPFVDVYSLFNLGALYSASYAGESSIPVAASTGSGVFAGTAQPDTRLGTQRGLLIYVHDQGTADIDTRIWSGSTTMRQYAANIADDQRRWLAANSGGRMDMRYDIVDGAIGLNPSTGQKWGGGLDTVDYLVNQAGLNKSDYAYVQLIWDHMFSSQYVNNPGGGVIGLGFVGNGSGTRSFWGNDYSRKHELGHNLGFGHASSYSSAGGGYRYDFATKQYVASSTGSTGAWSQLTPLSIGLSTVEYGNPVDIMGNQTTFLHYSPRDKQAAGWLKSSQFKNLGTVVAAPNQPSAVQVYAHQALQVTTRGTGNAMEYGVTQGYGEVAYAGTFARRAQRFIANADKTGGDWQYYIQNVDLYYSRLDNGAAVPSYGLEFRVDGNYLGVMQLGQTINDKDIGNYIYMVDSGKDLVNDLHAAAPDNPDRYRSTKYTLNFSATGSDATGPYANLIVTANIGVTAAGLRFDSAAATGAQNGSGSWSVGSGRWYDIDHATNDANWSDGSRAVIGGGTGAAGTVTITGTVAAKGITFDGGNGTSHRLSGGTLALGDEGLIAVENATIASDLRYDAAQFWDVAMGKTVNATGAVTTQGNSFDKIGGGAVSFSAADALSVAVAVHEGTVTQSADQTPTSLSIGTSATYRVEGGTLALTNGKSVSGDGRLVLATAASSTANPALWLGKGIAWGTNPSVSGDVSTNVSLESGTQVVRFSTGVFANYDAVGFYSNYPYGYALISGDISGAGALAVYGESTSSELVLSGTNTFTGGIEMRRGVLTPVGANAIPNATKLTFNTASGDVARFYLRGVDRTISDLASTGTGTAVIANSTGATATNQARATPGTATLHIIQNNDGDYAGIITDTRNDTGVVSGFGATGSAGALSLNKLGSATLTLSGTANAYTGSTTVSAGTLRLGSTSALPSAGAVTVNTGASLDLAGNNNTLGSLAGAGSLTLGSATVSVGSKNTDTTFSGIVSGTGGLTKLGTGKLTLSGQNTYTGATAVNAGSLGLDFSAATATSNLITATSALQLGGGTLEITGKAGATLTQAFASTAVLTGNSGIRLVQNGATSLDVNLGAITRTAGTLDFSGITGAAVGARVITSSGTASGLLDGGAAWATVNGGDWAAKDASNTYVVAYSNYTDVSTVGTLPNTPAADIRIIEGGAGTITLTAQTTAVNSILMRADTSAGVIATAGKTLETSAIAVARTAKTLTVGTAFGDGTLTSGTGALLLLNNLAPADGALTVNAVIADKGATALALTASGGSSAGIITLAADNTYSGGTTLTNGVTLRVGAGGTSGSLGSGAVALNAGTHLVLDRTGTLTLSGVISGAGDIAQSGSGTTVFSAANTYSGGTTLNAGTLRLTGAGTLGSGALALTAGSTLEVARTDTYTLGNTLSGAGDFLKSGSGTLTLSAANTHSGATTVTGGTLNLNNTLRNSSGLTVGTGATANLNATNMFVGGHGTALDATRVITVDGGTLTFASGMEARIGNVALNNGATMTLNRGLSGYDMLLANTSAGAATISVGGTGASLLNGPGGLHLQGVQNIAVGAGASLRATATFGDAGSSGGAAGGLNKTGAGTLHLAGANTYTGGTTVNAGTLLVSGAAPLSSGTVSVGDATLAFTNAGLIRSSFSGGSMNTASAPTGTLVTADFSPMHNTSGTVVPGNTTYAYTGKIFLTAGQWSFGENFDDGAFIKVDGQTLVNNSAWNTPTAGAITIAADGWYDLDLRVFNAGGGTGSAGGTWTGKGIGLKTGAASTDGSLYTRFDSGALGTQLSAGDITVANAVALTGNASVDTAQAQSATVTLTGTVSGSGSLTKTGANTLKLTGTNTYAGGTSVSGGSLIAHANAALGTGSVTVNSGGTLNTGLSGTAWTIANAITVNAGGTLMGVATHTGAVTINSGGTLAPGNSPGLATFSGGLSFTSGAAYAWEFLGNNLAIAGTDFDQLVITGGTMAITSGALLKFTASGVDYTNAFWDTGRSFLIADTQGPGLITGSFTTDTSAAGAFATEGAWSLNYAGGDVYAVWTAIPEPHEYGLLGAGAILALRVVSRRRKRA